MIPRVLLLSIALLMARGFADDQDDRAKLAGKWQLTASTSGEFDTWTIELKGDALHITHFNGQQKVAEFECNTLGRDCEIKESGRTAKVSIWFNGSKLVELETKGSEIVKREFSTSVKGDTLEMAVIPVVPDGKAETQRFHRVPDPENSAAAAHPR